MDANLLDYDRSKVVDADIYGEVKRWPYPYYADWATKAPFYIESEGYPQAIFTRFDDTRSCLQDFARFSSVKQPWPGTQGFYFMNSMPTLVDSDPPDHTRRRRLMAPAFAPRKLATMDADIAKAVDRRLDMIEDKGGEFDAVADLCKPLGLHTLLTLVCNIPEENWSILTDLVASQRGAFNKLSGKAGDDERYQAAWARARAYCEATVDDRRRNPRDDLVSDIVATHDEGGKITTEELFATLVILYSAGIGALINYPSWTLWRLMRHPDQLQALRAEPELLQGALTESLRIDPSSYASLRYATGDFEYEGLKLRKGMPVHTLSASGNFDPVRFPDPLRFDIRRPTDWKNLTSFGHGVHHCIGNGLARLSTRIVVERTLARFPRLRMENREFRPEIEGVLKQRSPISIPMRFD